MNIFIKQLKDAHTVDEFNAAVADMQKNGIILVRKRDNKRFFITSCLDACLVTKTGKPYVQGIYAEHSEIRDNVETPYFGYSGGSCRCQLRNISKYFDAEVNR